MKNKKQVIKQLFQLVEKELLAVIAVAIVLSLVFSQSFASTPMTPSSEISSNEMVYIQTTNENPFGNSPTLKFGQEIKGINNTRETWTDAKAAANFGNSILATTPTQVTVSQINNGTWTLYLSGLGDITINGTKYLLGKNKTIGAGTVTVSNNLLVIKFEANAQLWEITTIGSLQTTVTQPSQTPSILSLVPAKREMKIGTILTPVPLLQDQSGNIISKPIIEWTSSDTSVATVSNIGTITAINSGTATISARVSGTNLIASISINILGTKTQEAPPVFEINVDPKSQEINDMISNLVKEATEFVAIDKTVEEAAPLPQPTTGGVVEEETTTKSKSTIDVNKVFKEEQNKSLLEDNSSYVSEETVRKVLNETELNPIQKLTIKINLGFKQVVSDLITIFTGSNKVIIDTETNEEIIIEQPGVIQGIKNFFINLFSNKE